MEIPEIPVIPPAPRHSPLSAFRHKNFRLFYAGQTISLIGTWSQGLAISWLVWRLTHSAVWLGIIGFTVQFPMLLFGLPGGWAADRFDRLRSLTLMQLLCMLQAVILSALTLLGIVTLWQIFALSIMLGTVYAFEFPLRQSFVMDMAGKHDLLNAVSLNAAMMHATRALGPVAAGAIVAWKGEGICFAFNAATFLFLIAALLMMDRRQLIPSHVEDAPMGSAIHEGLLFVRGEPHARVALALTAAISILGMPFISLLPIFADRIYGGGSVELGWMMGASGAGALLGALWLAGRRSSERLLSLSAAMAVLFSIAAMVFSQLPGIWLALPMLAVMGFCTTINFSSVNTLLQQRAPDHLRGRAMSIFTIIAMGLAPFGVLAAGFAAKFLGAPKTVLFFAIACLVASAAIWLRARLLDEGKK